jgi:hypothetical protein
MTAVLAWVWAPAILMILLLGVGLLAERLLGARLPGALLVPVGLGVAVVLLVPIYRLHASATIAAPVFAVAGLTGLVVGRRNLRELFRPGPAGLAAAGTYLLYLAPVALSGHPTWAGYNFVNDTASNFILADLLEHHGALAPTVDSGTTRTATYLVTSGYPLGSHALLATLRPLTGTSIQAVYQPFLSALAAIAAMSLVEIARGARLRAASAVIAAVLAMGGVLLYRYTLHGAIKEIALVALAAASAALAALALERRLEVRVVALVALCCLAMVLVFSAAAAGFGVSLGVAVLAIALFSRERPSRSHVLRLTLAALAVCVVALLPTLGSTLDFANTARNVFAATGGASTGALGQLLRPLPVTEAAGVWLARDYRAGAGPGFVTLNGALVAVALVLAAVGALLCAVRRRFAPLLLLGMLLVPTAILAPFLAPYADAKFFVVLTPAVVLVAAVGALGHVQAAEAALRVAGTVAAVALAVGVLGSDAFGYRETRLAPTDRVAAMEDIGSRIPGNGLWLVNEWEEYAKFFMREARVNPAFEAEAPRPVKLREPAPIFGRWYDLDDEQLSYVRSFPGIVIRRSPASSRPPASFRRIYQNRYYELWQRDPSVRVRAHLPLQGADRAYGVPRCASVRSLARGAGPDERLLAAKRPRLARLSPVTRPRPAAWFPIPDIPGSVQPVGPGTIRRVLQVPGGRTRVWLRASGGRPYSVRIDGREVGEVGQVNTPRQWLEVAVRELSPGKHEVELRRPGADFSPGDAFRGELGPLVLEPARAPQIVAVQPRDADRLCGREWDWIELVSRG